VLALCKNVMRGLRRPSGAACDECTDTVEEGKEGSVGRVGRCCAPSGDVWYSGKLDGAGRSRDDGGRRVGDGMIDGGARCTVIDTPLRSVVNVPKGGELGELGPIGEDGPEPKADSISGEVWNR